MTKTKKLYVWLLYEGYHFVCVGPRHPTWHASRERWCCRDPLMAVLKSTAVLLFGKSILELTSAKDLLVLTVPTNIAIDAEMWEWVE